MEIRMLGAIDVLPTRSLKLEGEKFHSLNEIFNRGRNAQLNLSPANLLRTPSGDLLVMDGHYRFAQALAHDVEIWTRVYKLGDQMETPNGAVIFVRSIVLNWEITRRIVIMAGHNTFLDLYSNSFGIIN